MELSSQPLWIIAFVFLGTGLSLTLIILLVFWKFFPHGIVPAADARVLALIGSGVSSLCGLLFALIVVNVWQNFNQQEERLTMEAVELANLYRDSEGINKNSKAKIQKLTVDYTNSIIDYGWVAMEQGKEGKEAWHNYNHLHASIINYLPLNEKEELLYKRMVEHLNALATFRRLRLLNSNQGNIPRILWGIVVVAGVLSVSFTNFFSLSNKVAQAILTCLHAIVISMILMLVFMLNNPYRGPMKLSPYPFKYLVSAVFPGTDSIHAIYSRKPENQLSVKSQQLK